MKLNSAIPSISDYHRLLNSVFFTEMETFSNDFLARNSAFLAEYNRKWVADPLHQWSRQWEYPFVYNAIKQFVTLQKESSYHILDAGSGITFFPYLLLAHFPQLRVSCCDYDSAFKPIITQINAHSPQKINFLLTELQNIPFETKSIDLIYCISVLEHVNNVNSIIREWSRVLKSTGRLIITFDIALDGISDIQPQQADELLQNLTTYFKPLDDDVQTQFVIDMIVNPNIVTTDYIRQVNKKWLPWRYPWLSTLKSSVIKCRIPKKFIKNLTFYCQYYQVK